MDKRMRVVFTLAAAFFSISAFASGGGVELEKSGIDPGNINSLQRGARNFMNYCSGCHSAKYVRFNTIGKYLGLSDEQLADNLMFNAEKTFETINVSMRSNDAKRWFGTAPPDMSLMARSKGADYIFNFLQGFYVDPESPTGVDNRVLTGTSMPHVLWELQGFQKAVYSTHEDEDGAMVEHFDGFEPVTSGSLSDDEFDDFVRDTTNFLAYIAEPIRSDRRKLGVWVMMFLIFFLIISSMLKKQIWKDIK
jgi:ubiquinol-cytochrome c reductase cytochrome c1 subunit